QIIKSIGFTVPAGQTLIIAGPSGTGKSTLLRCVDGLETTDGGSIVFEGQTIDAKHRSIVALRRRIGMIFQNFNLYAHLTALENVMLAPVKILKEDREVVLSRAHELFRKVKLTHRISAYPSQLSGGEQQRVAIARALAMNPALLLFDEPTSALDPETVGDVLSAMRDLAAEGRTMLVVTHEMGFAQEAGDRMLVLADGKILEDSPPRNIIRNPKEERTRRFLGSVLQH
ncbi:MAG: amino acid ABC transporter ATP-binding protein, partial [Shinella sp.]